jgi:hypothetical protein
MQPNEAVAVPDRNLMMLAGQAAKTPLNPGNRPLLTGQFFNDLKQE